jgi:PAS domain S-box-containing protein
MQTPATGGEVKLAAIEVDRDGVILGWSSAAESLFELAPADVEGRHVSSLFAAAEAAWLVEALRDPASHPGVKHTRGRRESGETFAAAVQVTRLQATGSDAPRLAIVVASEEDAHQRSRFIAAIAHDLRQPISVIESAAFLLDRLAQDNAAQKVLGHIRNAALNLNELCDELLDVESARLAAELVLQREPLSLMELIDEVCATVQPLHPGHAISIDALDSMLGHWDRKRLRRVLQNLVENALVHSPPRAPIHISSKRSGGDIILAVENACAEPPVAQLEQLFEPFHRAGERGRVGLGLYIARELARAHGGDVLASWSARAIVFTLVLPTRDVDLAREAVEPETSPATFAVQRRHWRQPLDGELEVSARDLVFRAQGRDISRGGLAFFCDVELTINERIQIGVSTGPTSLRVLGTVRHVNPESGRSLVGIEFPCDLSPAELDLLKKPLRC